MKVRCFVIRAIVKRDLGRYFSNPAGYVFITLFIFLSAAAAFWPERFFLNNLANLDLLNGLFPYLLLFFIPTLTMGVWASEKKEGTDELLLTLPATDIEVVLGKYIATMGIYSAALLLSASHVAVLLFLGSPDFGLMLGNYIGYWLMGGALIAIGMFASLLTANITIAFILGALFCSVPVFVDSLAPMAGRSASGFISALGVIPHFEDYGRGVMSLSGLLYFLSLAVFMLYLNVVLLGRRHWPPAAFGRRMWLHHTVRAVALVTALVSANALWDRAVVRLDVTAEQLHSLSSETVRLLSELDATRPVFIQAYVSGEVPEQYVQQRENLIGFLKEIDAVAGSKVAVDIIATEPFTPEAREAREKFGIVAQEIPNLAGARAGVAKIFMGVAMTCGADEEVITFFDRGLPVEYELTRSIRVVARTGRKKIGVLTTGAKLFGGLDYSTMRSNPAWPVVDELKKQYEVVQIAADSPIEEKLDGLLVALPSSLSQEEMDNLLVFMEKGTPTLLLIDPLLIGDVRLSPSEEAGADENPFMRNRSQPPKPKGDITALLQAMGVSWNKAHILWDMYNPHPGLAQLPPEVVFVGQGNENPEAFNEAQAASSGLQEIVLLYPGAVTKAAGDSEFIPLLQTSRTSGLLAYQQLVQRSFFGMQLVTRGLRYVPNSLAYTLAARVRSDRAAMAATGEDKTPAGEKEETADKKKGTSAATKKIDAIVIADLDFISEQFFEIRKRGLAGLDFDNITFFLNCMDVLAGDDSFVALRKRRVRHRTLEAVEARTRSFMEQRTVEEKQAESEAEQALNEAQERLKEKVDELTQRTDLDERTKQIMARNLQEVESRRFEALQTNIEAAKQAKIEASKENMEEQINAIQDRIKTFAILLPPVPVIVVGLLIAIRRRRREIEGAAAARKLRS